VYANATVAENSNHELDGYYCGEKSVDLLLFKTKARVVAKFDPGYVAAFKVTGDVKVPWCKHNRYALNGGDLTLDDTEPKSRCAAALLNKYGASYEDGQIRAASALLGEMVLTPTISVGGFDGARGLNADEIKVEVDGIPILGHLYLTLSKKGCGKESKPQGGKPFSQPADDEEDDDEEDVRHRTVEL
jgi:hypothetical protein